MLLRVTLFGAMVCAFVAFVRGFGGGLCCRFGFGWVVV